MKMIVAHIGPDLDACASIWLIKTYIPGWEDAEVVFVPAGTTYKGQTVDIDPEILHVDTGYGKFDHHQNNDDTCAALKVYESLDMHDVALERIVHLVNDIDHFREVFFPNPAADFWNLGLPSIIDGWRVLYADTPEKIVSHVMDCLDGMYMMMKNKIWAEKELKEHITEFETKWGKGFGIETLNDEVVHYGQKMGYVMVIRKDPKKGYVRIKALPKKEIDLADLYEQLKKADPTATWFLHPSHHMILNGSAKNPDMRPSTLSIQALIEIVSARC